MNAHSLELVQISRILARRQNKYVSLVKNIQDHFLEAFYKRKLLECIELNKDEMDGCGKTLLTKNIHSHRRNQLQQRYPRK